MYKKNIPPYMLAIMPSCIYPISAIQLHQWNLSVSVCVCVCGCEIKLCYFTSWDLGQVYCLNCYIIITMLLSRSNVLKFSCTIYVL